MGWTGSNAHLEAYLKAAPLLEIQMGLVKETWSRKTSLCATSSVSPPQKPHFYTLVGWTGSNAHLEAYLKAAPLLEIQVGLVKETWSRKTSLCATSSVSPAPKAPLFHNSVLTMFGSYFEARLQAAPLLLEILGACKQTWYRKVGMGPSGVISRFHKSLGVGMMIPILRLECSPCEYDA